MKTKEKTGNKPGKKYYSVDVGNPGHRTYKYIRSYLYQCSEGDVPDSELYARVLALQYNVADYMVSHSPEYDKCDKLCPGFLDDKKTAVYLDRLADRQCKIHLPGAIQNVVNIMNVVVKYRDIAVPEK